MPENGPSTTARRVAAYRLAFDRVDTTYGDPPADEALARDVAGTEPLAPSEGMGRYLQARTRFFDRVVVNAVGRDVRQFVAIGAGYDGRAWRYAVDGARWWEVDHPDTQADKRRRLSSLGINTDHVTFVARDLAGEGLAAALISAGYEADAPSLLLGEGVAVYLDPATLTQTLRELRAVAAVGTRLAISLRTEPTGAAQAERRQRFEARVASLGEPARNSISAADTAAVLSSARWRETDISDRARRAGFVMAAPLWHAPDEGPASESRVGRFIEAMLHRAGNDTLAAHLTVTYGTAVTAIRQLDLGVHRVDLADGARWIARVFPSSRPVDATRADAAILDWLAQSGVPAERCAHPEPVSIHDGQPVLVTTAAPGKPGPANPATFELLGHLLTRLHRLQPPTVAQRPGGAWHHLILDAGPTAELEAARDLLDAARHRVPPRLVGRFDLLAGDLADLSGLAGLPHAFVHPDPVPRNLLMASNGKPTLIDWAGAGWAPRLLSLGCLLWAVGRRPDRLRAVAAGYELTLDAVELDSLPSAMRRLPLILASWTFATGRDSLDNVSRHWVTQRAAIDASARQATELLQRH